MVPKPKEAKDLSWRLCLWEMMAEASEASLVATRVHAKEGLLIRPCKHPGKMFED